MRYIYRVFVLLVMGLVCTLVFTSAVPPKKYRIYDDTKWADSVLATLTLDEKIGQLFMVDAFSHKEKFNLKALEALVNEYKIGGVIFFKGSPAKQVEMTNQLQSISKIPLLVGIDAEWGLAMRLDSTIQYGYQMPMGALRDDSLIYKMGRDLAWQCKRMGIHINFAPVVDINNNPLNPVIHMRSFGENKFAVARKATMYLRGMQDQHVLAVAKHYPGHGNTSVDSHLDLPVLLQNKKEMDTLELYPFRYLFNEGVGGVMSAHLNIPAYDTTPNVGASLSPKVITDMLRWKQKYNGLVFSDALNMKGVTKFFPPGELEVRALRAGNDVLLYSEDVPKATKAIKKAVEEGCLDEAVIDDKVRRILAVKHWAGLEHCHYIPQQNLTADINKPDFLILKQHIAEQSVTLVKNSEKLIPLKNLKKYKIASVAIGTRVEPAFQLNLRNYYKADYFIVPMLSDDSMWRKIRDTLKNYNLVIISLHNLSNKNTGTYGLSQKAVDFVNDINKLNKTVLVSFGSPYALSRFPGVGHVICGYQDEAAYQLAAAELLGGGIGAKSKLPVTASREFSINTGVTSSAIRMRYTMPEEAGMSSEKLKRIDEIVNNAIKLGAMPGCQVLVAKDGKVVYNKGFGKPTYFSANNVTPNDVYDLASVTKVAATTLAAMHLVEHKKLSLKDELGELLPELKNTDKADLTLKELLTHQSGLIGWIPFYKFLLTAEGKPDTNLFRPQPSFEFPVRVAENLYARQDVPDTLFKIINASRLEGRGKMRYSDLGFLYLQRVIEKQTGVTIDKLTDSLFYKPLGLGTLTYKPREKNALYRIMPTEQDTYFRQQLIQGDVHDPAAALLGGVAGHAGLFSNANDMAVLLQMLLNGGVYGGQRYFNPNTIRLFTTAPYEGNRKALGWDKPPLDAKLGSPASKYASPYSYGHTGFTGTCVWVDPEYNLIYIFLSNRVYPTAENTKLAKMNIRTDIHDIIYESFLQK